MKTNLRTTRASLLALALATAAAASASQEYEVINVGNLPGADSGQTTAINNSNVVVGWSQINGHSIGFRWTEGGQLENMNILNRQDWIITDINDAGISTGYWGHDGVIKGFIDQYLGFQSHNIWYNEPLDGETESHTYGINNLNHMVGSVGHDLAARRSAGWMIGGGFLYPGLGNGEPSEMNSINDADTAAGYVTVAGKEHAAVFFNNQTVLDLHALIPNAFRSSAKSINDQGCVTGTFLDQNVNAWGFYYNPELGMQVVENTPGFDALRFYRCSNNGIVVGSGLVYGNPIEGYATRWSSADGVIDLNTLIDPNSGWRLDAAYDVNENGYIVGVGRLNGVVSNFMLKPVPEPASLAALGLGVVGLIRRRRRAK